MPIAIDDKTFENFEDAVSWVKQNRPDIEDPEAFVAEIERKQQNASIQQSDANIVSRNDVLPPEGPGIRARFKKKTCKESDIFECATSISTASLVKDFGTLQLFQRDDEKFAKFFLINADRNRNGWQVTPESIPKFIQTFVGMPYISEVDLDRGHFGAENMNTFEILKTQEDFRAGNIIEVGMVNGKENEAFAVVKITNDAVWDELQNAEAIYVSPAVTGRPTIQPDGTLLYNEWFGLHLARVNQPAYGVMAAFIKETCEGPERKCIKQLITSAASVNISFNPLGQTSCQKNKMSQAQSTTKAAVGQDDIAEDEDIKKLKSENASLKTQLANAISEKDTIEEKEKQTQRTASEMQTKLSSLEERLGQFEEEKKNGVVEELMEMLIEDEILSSSNEEELEEEKKKLLGLSSEQLSTRLASAQMYHAKVASLKEKTAGLASNANRKVRMASTASDSEGRERITMKSVARLMP